MLDPQLPLQTELIIITKYLRERLQVLRDPTLLTRVVKFNNAIIYA